MNRWEAKSGKWEVRNGKLWIFIFLTSYFLLLTSHLSFAWATTITADHLEYFRDEGKYVATGNVTIKSEDSVLRADNAVLFQKTSDAEARGHVVYEDDKTLIHAGRVELNLDTKTGTIFNAIILVKAQEPKQKAIQDQAPQIQKPEKPHYWVKSDNVKKLSDRQFYAQSATLTTCDSKSYASPEDEPQDFMDEKNFSADAPDWCFKGKNVDMVIGGRLTASNATFRIKGLPVLYSPFLWAPVMTERQTGFLVPLIGNSSTKGFRFSPAFFWAIDENKDATFSLDYYSKRGIGTGIEYRYIDFNDKGSWYAYNIQDRKLDKDYFELKGVHDHKLGDARGYLDINYINHNDFLKEYAERKELRTSRFLQSTGEISVPFSSSRLYLLSQYWIDLKEGGGHPAQRLPELGYVINPVNAGPLMFAMTSSVSNFYREKDPMGQRLDIKPSFSYAFGDGIRLFQSLTLRETAYNLQNEGSYGSSPHRETLEYKAIALTRFIKKYDTFTHIVEPSLSYSFIPNTHNLPVFDSTELFNKASVAQLSLYNGLAFQKLSLSARLTQPYDLNAGKRPFMPTRLEASLTGPVRVTFDASHDFSQNKTETINTEISLSITDKTTVSFGERYSKDSNIMLYKFGANSVLSKMWAVTADIWYDSKNGGLRDSTIKTTYTQQCWAVNLALTRRPRDAARPAEFIFMMFFDLKGLGIVKVL